MNKEAVVLKMVLLGQKGHDLQNVLNHSSLWGVVFLFLKLTDLSPQKHTSRKCILLIAPQIGAKESHMHLSVWFFCQQYSKTKGPFLPLSHSLCSFIHFMTAHHSQCCCFVATPLPGIFYVPIKTIFLVELPQEMHHWQFQP